MSSGIGGSVVGGGEPVAGEGADFFLEKTDSGHPC